VPIRCAARRFAGHFLVLHPHPRCCQGRVLHGHDVAVAMCGRARAVTSRFRRAPRRRSLVAMLPVSCAKRPTTGNFSWERGPERFLWRSATDHGDRGTLCRVSESTRRRSPYARLSEAEMLGLTSFLTGAWRCADPRHRKPVRPPFNLVISNCPGSRRCLLQRCRAASRPTRCRSRATASATSRSQLL